MKEHLLMTIMVIEVCLVCWYSFGQFIVYDLGHLFDVGVIVIYKNVVGEKESLN